MAAYDVTKVARVSLKERHLWQRWLGLTELCIHMADAPTQGSRVRRLAVGTPADLAPLRAALDQHIAEYVQELAESTRQFVDGFESAKSQVVDDTRYLRRSRFDAFCRAQSALLTPELRSQVETYRQHSARPQNLGAIGLLSRFDAARTLLDDTEAVRKRHNRAFMEREATQHANYFRRVEESELSPEQVEASLTYDDANITVAAAGSGKTSVIVSRVGYVLTSGMFTDEEVLVLAFNNKAAFELNERLRSRIGKELLKRPIKVRARTFHALGLSLILKERAQRGIMRRPKLLNLEGKAGQRLLRQILLDLMTEDKGFAHDLFAWGATCRYPEPVVEPFDDEDLAQHEKRYHALCKMMSKAKSGQGRDGYAPPIPTLDATCYVRSFEEARIVNWLYLRHVPFHYERIAPQFLTRAINEGLPEDEQVRHYIPDFTLPNPKDGKRSYYYEHFGIGLNNKAPHFLGGTRYVARANHKRTVFKKCFANEDRQADAPRFFETTSGNFTDGTIFEKLESELARRKISVGPVDEQRYENGLKAFGESDDLLKFITQFVMRFRDSGLTWHEIEHSFDKLDSTNAARAKLFQKWIRRYADELERRLGDDTLDYSAMLRRGLLALQTAAEPMLPVKFLLVDEFQDISRLRAQLVQAVLDQHPDDSILYCVGDDWQAINRFAGADIRIFKAAHDPSIPVSPQHPLRSRSVHPTILGTTYRCPQGIADVSKWFVMKGGHNPAQIDKPVSAVNEAMDNVIRVVEHGDSAEARRQELERQLDRIAGLPPLLDEHGEPRAVKVYILTRNRKDRNLPDGLDKSYFDALASSYAPHNLAVNWESLHTSKGLGGDYIIIVGMDGGYKGYPSDYPADPLLEVLLPPMGDTIDEERRLFYVGLTRAKREVTLLAVAERPSIFVHELNSPATKGKIEWHRMPNVVRYLCPHCERGWLRLRRKGERVGCMRYPHCGFSAKASKYPGLPATNRRQ